MAWLLDTNVISELRKGSRADAAVQAWSHGVPPESIYLSVLTVGEIRRGIDSKRRKDPNAADILDAWAAGLEQLYADRILPIDLETARLWGSWNAVRTLPVEDSLLAATAAVLDFDFVTRNEKDLAGLPVRLLNPWHFPLPQKAP